MKRWQVIGKEGGAQPVILLVFRRPFGVYFMSRVLVRHSYFRVRFYVGGPYGRWPRVKFTHQQSARCASCRAWQPTNDRDTCIACGTSGDGVWLTVCEA